MPLSLIHQAILIEIYVCRALVQHLHTIGQYCLQQEGGAHSKNEALAQYWTNVFNARLTYKVDPMLNG